MYEIRHPSMISLDDEQTEQLVAVIDVEDGEIVPVDVAVALRKTSTNDPTPTSGVRLRR